MRTEYITTESNNQSSKGIDELSSQEICRIINEEDKKVPKAIEKEIPHIAQAIDALAETYQNGGRIVTIGAGSSGRYGVIDGVELIPTFDADPDRIVGIVCGGKEAMFRSIEGAEDREELAVEDLKAINFGKKDILIGSAASGNTPYTTAALAYAASLGARTVAICCNKDSRMSQVAEICIAPVAGPEVISGSTRMKGGTIEKMVMNMLSTGAMIRSGRVFDNYMVYVQPRNKKLVERMKNMLKDILRITDEETDRLYEESGASVATAIVMYKKQVGREEALKLLDEAKGNVRSAIG